MSTPPTPGRPGAGAQTSVFSAAESGDTVRRRWRILIRALAVLALVSATVLVAQVRGPAPPAEDDPSGRVQAADSERGTAAREVRLLEAEDARLRLASQGNVVGIARIGATTVLGARATAYTLADLVGAGAATPLSATTVLLTEPIAVRRDAVLEIDAPGLTLRMLSTAEKYTSLVSWGGSITLSGSAERSLRVVGWDRAAERPDATTADGRAYIRVKDGALSVEHVVLSDMGFWSGRTGGLALTGSTDTRATAVVSETTIDRTQIGLYVSGAQRVRVQDLRITRPQRHGVELTNRTSDVVLRGLRVRGAGEDGLSVSNGTSRVTLEDAALAGSGRYGIDVDGSPLADGPNSAGYGIENYAGLTIRASRVSGGGSGGVRVMSVDDVLVQRTRVAATRSALVVQGSSRGVRITDADLASVDGTALVLADGVRSAVVEGSTARGAEVGVEVDGSTATLRENDITVGTGHAVWASGSETTVALTGNTLHGRGAGAAVARDGATLETDGADGGEWTQRAAVVMWAERNSAALPLLLVLLVPAVGLVFGLRRRRRQRRLRRLFEEAMVARGRISLETYRVGPEPQPAPVPSPAAGRVPTAEVGVPSGLVRRPIAADRPWGGDRPAPAAPTAEVLVHHPPAPAEPHSAPATIGSLAGRDFESVQEFAIAAVRDAGYPISMVARVLHVPTSRVRAWLDSVG